MTAVTTAVDGWDAQQLREPVEADLAARFPEAVSIYFGRYTRKWWALTKDAYGKWRHLEADRPYDLANQLEAARTIWPDHLEPAKPAVAKRGRHARRRGTH